MRAVVALFRLRSCVGREVTLRGLSSLTVGGNAASSRRWEGGIAGLGAEVKKILALQEGKKFLVAHLHITSEGAAGLDEASFRVEISQSPAIMVLLLLLPEHGA